MTLFKKPCVEITESEAKMLSRSSRELYAVEVKPPLDNDVPATVEGFVQGILEIQTRLWVKNTSPFVAFEIYRVTPDRLRLQYVVPTQRLMRKVMTQLSAEVPGTRFDEGVLALPILPGESIGGGILTPGREDKFPFKTDFHEPPVNRVVASLHRDAMKDTKIVLQILFRPVAGHPVKNWWWKHRNYQTVEFLRKEKEKIWGSRSATPRERSQADAVEAKTGQRRFWTSVRVGVIGAGEYTLSRVKEIAAGFNIYENPESGQYFDTFYLRKWRKKHFLGFFKAVRDRRFGGYSLKFQASTQELASFLSVPDREQRNLRKAV